MRCEMPILNTEHRTPNTDYGMNGFWRQFKGELFRLFARKRTYIGFGSFLTIEALVLYFLQKPKVKAFYERMLERNGYGFEDYFSALTLGLIILVLTVAILGTLYLALVAGDIVAKESEDGTLRMVLARPVSRFRLLLVKYLSCLTYTAILMVFLGVSALGVGLIDRGWGGGLFAFLPEQGVFSVFDFWPGLGRYGLALVFLTLSMQTVSSIGFCLSCQRMKPAAATILTVSLLFIDFILSNMPALSEYRHWFLSPRLDQWVFTLRDVIPWARMARDYALLFGINVTCFVVGWVVFQVRDLKS